MADFSGDYRPGQPYGICDRCDTKTRLYSLKREWTNLLVCEHCWDPEPVHLHTPYLDPGEGAPIPDARPELIVEVDDTDLDFLYRDGTTLIVPGKEQLLLTDDDGIRLFDDDNEPLWDD